MQALSPKTISSVFQVCSPFQIHGDAGPGWPRKQGGRNVSRSSNSHSGCRWEVTQFRDILYRNALWEWKQLRPHFIINELTWGGVQDDCTCGTDGRLVCLVAMDSLLGARVALWTWHWTRIWRRDHQLRVLPYFLLGNLLAAKLPTNKHFSSLFNLSRLTCSSIGQ